MSNESTMTGLLVAIKIRDDFYAANVEVKPFPYRKLDQLGNRVDFFATELRRKVFAFLAAQETR